MHLKNGGKLYDRIDYKVEGKVGCEIFESDLVVLSEDTANQ